MGTRGGRLSNQYRLSSSLSSSQSRGKTRSPPPLVSDRTCLPDRYTVSSLEDLRQLDLDGNPCARCQGYKHRIVRSWPRLHELDGEEICQLDIDLSALFFEEQQTATVWKVGGSIEGSRKRRPATAPAKCRKFGNQTSETAAPEEELASAHVGPQMGLERIPMGKARLLKSNRLNNDPQASSTGVDMLEVYKTEEINVYRTAS